MSIDNKINVFWNVQMVKFSTTVKHMHNFIKLCFVVGNLHTQHKKASNHHANLPLEMYSFT